MKILLIIAFFIVSGCSGEVDSENPLDHKFIEILPGKDSLSYRHKYYRDVEMKQLVFEAEFTKGVPNGITNIYYENGKIRRTFNVNFGKISKWDTYFKKNGTKKGAIFYSDDQIILAVRSFNTKGMVCSFRQFDFHSNVLVEQVMDSVGNVFDSQIKILGKPVFLVKNENNEFSCVDNHNLRIRDSIEIQLPVASVDKARTQVLFLKNNKFEPLKIQDYLIRKKLKFDSLGTYKYLIKAIYSDTIGRRSNFEENLEIEFVVK